jgi:two-component system, OmpR family, KDP operon response regulator KdpE
MECMAIRSACRPRQYEARILVVDDEPGILRFLRAALVANDFEFESAQSVQEVIKSIASRVPDDVMLDLGLPDGDGKQVIRQVRAPLGRRTIKAATA